MMLPSPNFSQTDNEQTVRERFVAPLLRALGYREEEIQAEYPLPVRIEGKVSWIFADYVLLTTHDFALPPNKVIIEVKRPSVSLASGADVLEQARLYASHRDVQATYVVLVNGLELAIYEPSGPQLNLVRRYDVATLDKTGADLAAILGAPALRCHFAGAHIIQQLGTGGYGRVFKSRDIRLGRVEALKVLHPGSEHAESIRQRFERGAMGPGGLKHQNICEVYYLGTYRGSPYYRMEFIDGESVLDYVTARNLDLPNRLRLFRQFCDGLAHAHKNGVVHCDLKPANLLIQADGTPKIIDFDFCHLATGASTTLSQVVATIAYMDPTIWINPHNRDARADIYSAGLLLWSILTGRELTPGWTPHNIYLDLLDLGTAGKDLGQLILGCLQENRDERPESVEALQRRLGMPERRVTEQGLVDGATSSFVANSPSMEFQYFFGLWQQTKGLPTSADFDRLSHYVPNRRLTSAECEFVFRGACACWSRKHRSIFRHWSTTSLVTAASTVLEDYSLDEPHRKTVGYSHPARQAIDILAATDEYRARHDSEEVARFLMSRIRIEKRPAVFYTILDILARLKCFEAKSSSLRKEISSLLIDLIKERFPNPGRNNAKQIAKLLGKLDPKGCGDDSSDVAYFLLGLAKIDEMRTEAVKVLSFMRHPHATDAFMEILEQSRGSEQFTLVAEVAVGLGGRNRRPEIATYLSELRKVSKSEDERRIVDTLFANPKFNELVQHLLAGKNESQL